ncbi:MAG: hypothetical protein HY820_37945 [Acidobacteria bacterium]|nr:hypothetical protein [Acidobacteriota bacterium]
MTRLIDAQFAASRKRDLREAPPSLLLHRRASGVVLFHCIDKGIDIVAHQVELVNAVLLPGVHRHLGGRQSEDQPALAGVDVREAQNVFQEGAVGFRILRIDDGMGASDHGAMVTETLRVWEHDDWLVVLGRSCREADDVCLEACAADGVRVIRRESGGGTVLLGPGCVNFEVSLSLERRPALLNVADSYCVLLRSLARALDLGCEVAGSDLLRIGRKVSGNAQRRVRGHLIHHGTLLSGMDLSRVTRYLREPRRRPAHRGDRTHEEFLANLPMGADEVRERLRKWGAKLGVIQQEG